MHFAALFVMQRFIKTVLLIPNWLLLRSATLEKGHVGTVETVNACRDNEMLKTTTSSFTPCRRLKPM
jgi:hypothetical protein